MWLGCEVCVYMTWIDMLKEVHIVVRVEHGESILREQRGTIDLCSQRHTRAHKSGRLRSVDAHALDRLVRPTSSLATALPVVWLTQLSVESVCEDEMVREPHAVRLHGVTGAVMEIADLFIVVIRDALLARRRSRRQRGRHGNRRRRTASGNKKGGTWSAKGRGNEGLQSGSDEPWTNVSSRCAVLE